DGQPMAAAVQAAAAGDWAHASSLIVEHLVLGRLMVGDDRVRLGTVFERMPAETDGAAPSIVRAAIAVAANGERARVTLSPVSIRDARDSPAIRLAIATLRAVDASADLEVDRTVAAAATVAGLAITLADAGRPVPPDLLATVLTAKGAMLLWSGQLNGSEDSLTEALRAAEVAGLRHLRVQILGKIALLNAVHGRLRQAARSANSASHLADQLGLADKDRPAVIDAAFAWIHTERWDVDAARRHARSVNARDDPLAVAVLTVVRDRRGPGQSQLAESNSPDVPRPRWLTSGANPAVAEWTMPTLAGRVGGWLRTAAEQLDLGRSELATRSLDRALTLAAPENLRRPIVQAPLRLRRLIRQNPELTRRHGWLGPDAIGIPNDDRMTPALVEPLTNREREVLRHMAALLSTEEIAQAMFVSVNTVKTHIRGVLRKLSVGRRNDAIRRAWEIGLL
ncbi:MAG TPA: LuxR C-terminal-related transcriptional regulator, partial [Pseudonocardiaceae bacterium]